MTFSNAINWLRRDGPRWENLGITLSAGTFSITQANGSALSANDAGYVTLPSKASPGQQIVYRITANQTFIDDAGSSTIIGNLFGLTTGIAYAVDTPFFIYAVSNDAANAISFMISRMPGCALSPVSANIGKTGSAVADTQGSFFAFENPTVTDYDQNPCICIGAIRMRMSASDDWTVQALANGSTSAAASPYGADGIGQFHERSRFSYAVGQFGASASTFFKANGGTAPIFASPSCAYYIRQDATVLLFFSCTNTSGNAGVGAVAAQFALPFIPSDGPNISTTAAGNGLFTSASSFYLRPAIDSTANNLIFNTLDQAALGTLLNSSFTSLVGLNIQVGIQYNALYV